MRVDVNHDNIRNEMAIQIAGLTSEKAVLQEQVRVLANDKVNLETQVRELEDRIAHLERPAEKSEPVTEVVHLDNPVINA
ncbi:hypothetical protein BK703_16850 [Bacillus thuringiensis serovar silo]|uniref:hypothetical protein n=1 Tax=Bacillus thuringiensis TaxID=1428 RepID=UPI000A3A3A34|nr:hypothetical protein [Bacillus thuringiensis]MED3275402.1 hypothetical protein [Bacillus thuringiensis]OTW55307.1 hypothetical protein BK703_16850 [Bacillus thuringiensis serovar silo]OTW74261.1 hypothetical protein BK700_01195 [Bacillus thuringiensis serovar toguchini]